jgi:hypothetical protein
MRKSATGTRKLAITTFKPALLPLLAVLPLTLSLAGCGDETKPKFPDHQ